MHVWHHCLLIAIMLLLSSGEPRNSTNLCKDSDIDGFKTWGPNCQLMCHCRQEAACDSRGYCANGCTRGWTRLTPNGSCSVPVMKNPTLNTALLADLHYNYDNEIRDHRQAFAERNMPLYRFLRDEICSKEENGVKSKFASIKAEPPILLQEFTVIFKVRPLGDDITKVTFKIKNSEDNSVSRELKYDPIEQRNTLSVKKLRYVLVDSIIVSVSSTAKRNCTPAVIEGFILSGKPICPYGKWGIRCEHRCPCRCRRSECHPTSGRCLEKGLICPAERFGQLCSSTCSTKCFGYPRECHPLTGSCKKCQLQSLTGVSCKSTLPPEEMVQRDMACTGTLEEGNGSINESKSVYDQAHPSTREEKSKYGVAILALVFLIIFIIICCSYIQMVQYCAKQRIRKQIFSLDEDHRRHSSLTTYTEFKKEFMEMERYRKGSIPSRSVTDQLEGYGSRSEIGTSYTTRAEPPLQDSPKLRSMSASRIQ